ncbi:hypothetical protein [Roseateles sp. P5_D6]
MLRQSASPVEFEFSRSGGTIVLAQLDIWQPGANDWTLVATQPFSKAKRPSESVALKLPKGSYTCVFQCFVQESLNGKYGFTFAVAGQDTYADGGDVNTTAAKDDTKAFKDQFILEVA